MSLIFWEVMWVEWDMPGGMLGKFIPSHLKPFLGQAKSCYYVTEKKERAMKKVQSLDVLANPRLFWCENLKRYERDIEFQTVVKIEGGN